MSLEVSKIHPINEAIASDIKHQLRLQGHHLTGALEASIKGTEKIAIDETTLSATALGYIEDLEDGVPASEIKINSQTLAEMTRYVELRMGYKGSKAQQVALLILQKQKKEGNPTDNSYNYSQTGARKFAIEITFNKNEAKYFNAMDNVVEDYLDAEFHQLKNETI